MSIIRLSLIGLSSRVFVLALTFVSSVVIARGVGPAGLGEYFVVVTTAALVATFCDLGLSSSAVVFSGERQRRVGVIGLLLLGVAVIVPLAVSTSIHALYPALSMWGHSPLAAAAAILIAPMTLYNNYWTFMLVGRRQIAIANAFQCVTYVVFTAFLIALRVSGRMSVSSIIAAHVAVFGAQMVAQAILVAVWRAHDAHMAPASPWSVLREMLRFGLPVYPSTVASVFSLRIGILMLAAFHGTFASGIYSVAFQLADKMLLIARSIQDAIYDDVIALRGSAAIAALNRYMRASILLFICITTAGILAAPVAVRLFYGPSFVESTLPLQVLIIGSALFGLAGLLSTYFVGQIKKPVILSAIATTNAMLAIGVNRLLIPSMAANGAAFAMLITQTTAFLATLIIYVRLAQTEFRSVLMFSEGDARDLRAKIAARLAVWRRRADV